MATRCRRPDRTSGRRALLLVGGLALGLAASAGAPPQVVGASPSPSPSPSPLPSIWPSPSPIPSPGAPIGLGAVLTPLAEGTGAGTAILTISGDRTLLTWHVSYANVSSPVTQVLFCAGGPPRAFPIDPVCAFAVEPGAGGPSPIDGSATIVPLQAETLANGYAVIQLVHDSTPLLGGYLEAGVAPSPSPASSSSPPSSVAGITQPPTDVGSPTLSSTSSVATLLVLLTTFSAAALAVALPRRRRFRR